MLGKNICFYFLYPTLEFYFHKHIDVNIQGRNATSLDLLKDLTVGLNHLLLLLIRQKIKRKAWKSGAQQSVLANFSETFMGQGAHSLYMTLFT